MKFKIPYNIKRAAFGVLPLLMLMGATPSCKKNRSVIDSNEPTPPQIEQHDDTIHWCLWDNDYGSVAPSLDSVAYYTNDPTVRHLFINLIPTSDCVIERTMSQYGFNVVRDTLQLCIDVAPAKVRGCGIVKVGRDGAHIHPDTLVYKRGMWGLDSLWFAQHGWKVERVLPLKSK